MRNEPWVFELLRCPVCGGRLGLEQGFETTADAHVLEGGLSCAGCRAAYPVRGGVPRILRQAPAGVVGRNVAGFGYEWRKANGRLRHSRWADRETFLGFIDPVRPDFFRGKTVLDAGCGTGRFMLRASEFGADAIVGVDLSESVAVAFENTRSLARALVVQGDIFAPPLAPGFDYAYSIGVLHHTGDPRRAFERVLSLVRPGGSISAWVYGRENNGWILSFIDPLRRRLTSRLPHGLLLCMAYVLAVPLYLVLKCVYRPLGKAPFNVGNRLFYFDYLLYLSRFGYREQAFIVFDHLTPTLAEYIAREEFAGWFRSQGLERVRISSRAGNSWRGFACKPPATVAAPCQG